MVYLGMKVIKTHFKKKKEKDGLILTDEKWRDFSGQKSLKKAEEV